MRAILHTSAGPAILTTIDGAAFAEAQVACPKCNRRPLRVTGNGRRPSADDRAWESDGACVDCNAPVGLIRAEVHTIFGVREDEAVFSEVQPRGGRIY